MELNKHSVMYVSMIVIGSMLVLSGFMPKEVIKVPLLLTFGAGFALIVEAQAKD